MMFIFNYWNTFFGYFPIYFLIVNSCKINIIVTDLVHLNKKYKLTITIVLRVIICKFLFFYFSNYYTSACATVNFLFNFLKQNINIFLSYDVKTSTIELVNKLFISNLSFPRGLKWQGETRKRLVCNQKIFRIETKIVICLLEKTYYR
jgi:hypothetical protein